MKDEIKKILDLLKYCVDKNEYLEEPNMKNWKPLLDYITKLQEENEVLKRDKNIIFDANCNLSKVMNDYKTRNEKAIEKCINKQYETNAPWLIKFAKDIENILQGKSDE